MAASSGARGGRLSASLPSPARSWCFLARTRSHRAPLTSPHSVARRDSRAGVARFPQRAGQCVFCGFDFLDACQTEEVR